MTAALERVGDLAGKLALPSLVLFLAFAFAAFANTWVDPSHRVVGVPPDAFLLIWFIRWTAFALANHHNPLVSTYMNYPFGLNLMWNASLLLPGALLAPITLTAGPVVAYNLLATLGLALSAWTATLAIRRFVPNSLAATAGGLLYGFSPYMFAQSAGHTHLTLAIFPPLVMILFREILGVQKRSPVVMGSLLGAIAAAQLLVGEEIAASTALAATTAVVWLVLLQGFRIGSGLRYAATAFAVAAAVAGLIAAVPAWVQFFGPRTVHGFAHNVFAADLSNFIVPTRGPIQGLDLAGSFTGNNTEGGSAYLGIPLILLLGATAIMARRQAVVRLAGLVGLTMAIFSLGPSLHVGGHDTGIALPYFVFDRLPIFDGLLPARLSLYVDLAAAVLLAVFVRAALTVRPRPVALGGVLLGVAALVTVVPVLPFYSGVADTPAFFTATVPRTVAPGQTLLVLPGFGPALGRPLLWQAEAGMRFRITAGYFLGPGSDAKPHLGATPSALSEVFGPVEDGKPAPVLDAGSRGSLRADLAARQVAAIVVGPMPNREATAGLVTDLLGRVPVHDGGVDVWWLSAEDKR